ncbi:hypothetical protein Tco_0704772 [Tanacetum coccineum]|uniref:Uncharacterized protein n=1 Tax=Tanacetum coccineum TaxID=301880 RepID=A0ABQ4Y3J7_9ASTR
MATNIVHGVHLSHHHLVSPQQCFGRSQTSLNMNIVASNLKQSVKVSRRIKGPRSPQVIRRCTRICASLDLTEDNVKLVLDDARTKKASFRGFSHLFDTSVGMTGVAELAEVDGPFVKIRLKGRFWHERSLILARLGNYLKERIPEILEVDIEDEKQLDDSPENF